MPEDFWILLQIPSMRRFEFIPGPKDISLSSRKSHVSRCNPASTGIFQLSVGLKFPGQGNSQARDQPTTPSTQNIPCLLLTQALLVCQGRGAGTSPCPFNALQSQPLQQSCPALIQHFLVTWTAPFSHPQNAPSFKVQFLLNWGSCNKQTELSFQTAGTSLNTTLAQTSLVLLPQKK